MEAAFSNFALIAATIAGRKRDRSNDGVVARVGPISSDAKEVPSCRAIFLMASPLLAVLLFKLLRMRLIK